MKQLIIGSLAAVALAVTGSAQAANYCGELKNHYGPYDYRMRGQVDLEVVERAHFTADVEAGIKGNTSYLGDDLSYTLLAIPNHLRALATLSRLSQRSKSHKLPNMRYAVECYFDRAIRFAPDDSAVRALYGSHLFARGRSDDALKMLTGAVELNPTDPTINYNIGLVYFDRKDYSAAMRHARVAYDLGFPLEGLKNKLAKVGKWEEAAPKIVE